MSASEEQSGQKPKEKVFSVKEPLLTSSLIALYEIENNLVQLYDKEDNSNRETLRKTSEYLTLGKTQLMELLSLEQKTHQVGTDTKRKSGLEGILSLVSAYGPKAKIRMARYYQKNKKERLQAGKEYYKNNKDKVHKYTREYLAARKERSLLYAARKRAKTKGLQIDLQESDIFIPALCPLLGIPLERSSVGLTANSPTLDRINSKEGYLKTNVWVISHRANTIKNNASLEEFEMILTKWKEKLNE